MPQGLQYHKLNKIGKERLFLKTNLNRTWTGAYPGKAMGANTKFGVYS